MPKAKISVTVERSLIRDCDQLGRGASRSEIVEKALTRWVRERRRKSLEDEIEQYYSALGAADRLESSQWAGLASRLLGETWK